MNELGELYQQVILDHNKQPCNFHEVDGSNRKAEGYNPLCGDRLTLYAKIEDGVVRDVGFVGSGCAISKASASMMTEAIKGKPVAEVEKIFKAFHGLVTEEAPAGENEADTDLGKLVVFSGVREFPMRVKCATLAWHTLRAALDNEEGTTTTE
jgi:nitrogen fixation NifU-like protein